MADRIFKSVLPSGIEFSVRNLKGKDHETLTKGKNLKDGSAFTKMLFDCLISVGNKTRADLTEKDAERLLSNDRKYALIQLRQHTLRYQEFFEFKYEWPLDEGSREKDMQSYSVKFTDEFFPTIPYKWVRERMEELKKEKELKSTSLNGVEDYDKTMEDTIEVVEPDTATFPVMFTNYDDVLKMAQRELVLPESGLLLRYQLLTVDQEQKWIGVKSDERSVNTPLAMRKPQIMLKPKGTKGKELIPTVFDIREADMLDTEEFRKDIKNMEGSVDTWLTIRNQNDPSKSVRVDLIMLPDFFFPSQAT